jgi:hypothetical protein
MNDIAYSFCKNIELMDRYRNYHKVNALTRYSNAGFFQKLKLAKMIDRRMEKYDIDLWRKVQKEGEEMGELPEAPKKENIVLSIWIFSMALFAFAAGFRVYILLLFLISIVVIILSILLAKIVWSRAKRSIQKSKVQKVLVQELIIAALDFFKKENINPEEYPLRLKYTDYGGLDYLEKRKYFVRKEYLAHLNLNLDPGPIPFIKEEKISFISTHSIILIFLFLLVFILTLLILNYITLQSVTNL